jgi:hypothetical protein
MQRVTGQHMSPPYTPALFIFIFESVTKMQAPALVTCFMSHNERSSCSTMDGMPL